MLCPGTQVAQPTIGGIRGIIGTATRKIITTQMDLLINIILLPVLVLGGTIMTSVINNGIVIKLETVMEPLQSIGAIGYCRKMA